MTNHFEVLLQWAILVVFAILSPSPSSGSPSSSSFFYVFVVVLLGLVWFCETTYVTAAGKEQSLFRGFVCLLVCLFCL